MGRAKRFRNSLEKRLHVGNQIDVVYLDKERVSGNEVIASKVVGNVEGKRVIILDDLISSGSTISVATRAVEKHGGEVWAACATHGLFVGRATENLQGVKRLVIADTIQPFRLDRQILARPAVPDPDSHDVRPSHPPNPRRRWFDQRSVEIAFRL